MLCFRYFRSIGRWEMGRGSWEIKRLTKNLTILWKNREIVGIFLLNVEDLIFRIPAVLSFSVFCLRFQPFYWRRASRISVLCLWKRHTLHVPHGPERERSTSSITPPQRRPVTNNPEPPKAPRHTRVREQRFLPKCRGSTASGWPSAISTLRRTRQRNVRQMLDLRS